MGIAVRQSKSYALLAEDGTTPFTLDSAVLEDSVLVVVACSTQESNGQANLLNSVTDTSSNTWQTPTNTRTADHYAPNVCGAYAENVVAGSPTVTLNWALGTSNRVTGVIMEITGALTASALDMVVQGTALAAATSTSTDSTGVLDQANNLLVLSTGGYFGLPENPSGWTSAQTNQNGAGGGTLGGQTSYKTTAATTAVVGTVTHEALGSTGRIIMFVFKESAAGDTYQYKFQFDSAKLTNADTTITGYVWRNAGPDGVLAEKYVGLAGDAVAGDLIVTGVPVDVDIGDTITGQFSNGTDCSGIVTGTVEVA